MVGRFARNDPALLFHEWDIARLRQALRRKVGGVRSPVEMTFQYEGAMRFEGHQIVNGSLEVLSASAIDLEVGVIAAYGGLTTETPPVGITVIGVLQRHPVTDRLSAVSGICPAYYQISAVGVADLLACYEEGTCE